LQNPTVAQLVRNSFILWKAKYLGSVGAQDQMNSVHILTLGLLRIHFGTHQLLAYADDVNLLGDNIDTVKKNTETLIDASKEAGLEINVEKTKYMLISRHQNVGQNREIRIANRSFENVSQFKYLGTTVKNQNLIQEEI
jgi:hypothetical protein